MLRESSGLSRSPEAEYSTSGAEKASWRRGHFSSRTLSQRLSSLSWGLEGPHPHCPKFLPAVEANIELLGGAGSSAASSSWTPGQLSSNPDFVPPLVLLGGGGGSRQQSVMRKSSSGLRT